MSLPAGVHFLFPERHHAVSSIDWHFVGKLVGWQILVCKEPSSVGNVGLAIVINFHKLISTMHTTNSSSTELHLNCLSLILNLHHVYDSSSRVFMDLTDIIILEE